MTPVNHDHRIVCGLIEALVGGAAMAAIISAGIFLSATITPAVGTQLTQIPSISGLAER